MSKSRECASGKVSYPTERVAALHARSLARHLNAEGIVAESLYSYRCRCGSVHLTRRSSFFGHENRVAMLTVSAEIQVQMMTAEARERYEQSEQRRRETTEQELKLPTDLDERSTPQAFVNRPRRLRRGA